MRKQKIPFLKNDRLLRVLNHLPVDRVPVWLMRQAGRTDPKYCQLRQKDGRALEEALVNGPSPDEIKWSSESHDAERILSGGIYRQNIAITRTGTTVYVDEGISQFNTT